MYIFNDHLQRHKKDKKLPFLASFLCTSQVTSSNTSQDSGAIILVTAQIPGTCDFAVEIQPAIELT